MYAIRSYYVKIDGAGDLNGGRGYEQDHQPERAGAFRYQVPVGGEKIDGRPRSQHHEKVADHGYGRGRQYRRPEAGPNPVELARSEIVPRYGLESLDRITSYNVCYTKLLRENR